MWKKILLVKRSGLAWNLMCFTNNRILQGYHTDKDATTWWLFYWITHYNYYTASSFEGNFFPPPKWTCARCITKNEVIARQWLLFTSHGGLASLTTWRPTLGIALVRGALTTTRFGRRHRLALFGARSLDTKIIYTILLRILMMNREP